MTVNDDPTEPLTLETAAEKLAALTQVIADADKDKAFAQLRAILTAATLLGEAYPDGADAHFITTSMLAHVTLDTITDRDGSVLWAADHDLTNYGKTTEHLPAVVNLANQLLETVGCPHFYMMYIVRAGMVPFIKTEPSVRGEWRERFTVPLAWD